MIIILAGIFCWHSQICVLHVWWLLSTILLFCFCTILILSSHKGVPHTVSFYCYTSGHCVADSCKKPCLKITIDQTQPWTQRNNRHKITLKLSTRDLLVEIKNKPREKIQSWKVKNQLLHFKVYTITSQFANLRWDTELI